MAQSMNSSAKPIRVLLADNNREFLQNIRALVQEQFEVVGSVEDGQQAVDQALALDPDLLVSDISMPKQNGFEVAAQLKLAGCRTAVIILSVHEDADYVAEAFAVGARGYVSKLYVSTDLIAALKAVAQGSTFVSAALKCG
jgi:DNA-binding NarL/FixJ family response regulator